MNSRTDGLVVVIIKILSPAFLQCNYNLNFFFLCGYFKDSVCCTPVSDIQGLKRRIVVGIAIIQQHFKYIYLKCDWLVRFNFIMSQCKNLRPKCFRLYDVTCKPSWIDIDLSVLVLLFWGKKTRIQKKKKYINVKNICKNNLILN